MDGRIDISRLKVPPEKHELDTARLFAQQGHDIKFIPSCNSPGIHTPDIEMDGLEWELKSPQGSSKRTIENNFRKASKQSRNIIIDLHRIHVSEAKCILQIKKEFDNNTHVKKVIIVKQDNEMIVITR